MNAVATGEQREELVIVEQEVTSGVERVLRESGYRDLTGLRCECHDGVITLMGRVSSYFLKQMAQTLAARVKGVTRINNQLRVS